MAFHQFFSFFLRNGAVQPYEIEIEPLDLQALPIALAVVAVATAVGSHLCWRRASGAGRPIHTTPADPAASFTFFILAWVLDESIAIYALVLGLLALGQFVD